MGTFRRFRGRCDFDSSSIWFAQIASGSCVIVTTLRMRFLTSAICSRSAIRFVPLLPNTVQLCHHPPTSRPHPTSMPLRSHRALRVTFIIVGAMEAQRCAHAMPGILPAHRPHHPHVAPPPRAGALLLVSYVRSVTVTLCICSAPFAPCAHVARLARWLICHTTSGTASHRLCVLAPHACGCPFAVC
jgi:hypothetical protein